MSKTSEQTRAQRALDRIGNKIDAWFEWTYEVVMDYWYDPLERLARRLPYVWWVLVCPWWCLAFALPPLVIAAVLLVPQALAVYGLLTLVGVV